MFKILLEAALSGQKIVNWRGSKAVVMNRSGDKVWLLIDKGPTKPVTNLKGGEIIAVGRYGELQPAEVLGRPALWYQKSADPPNYVAAAGREPHPEYHMKMTHKGDVDIRVRYLDNNETKIVKRDVRSHVPLLTVVNAAHFDAVMSGKKPPAPKEPEPERQRTHKYKFDSRTGEYVPIEEPEASEPEDIEPAISEPEPQPERRELEQRRKLNPEEEEEYQELRKSLKAAFAAEEPEEMERKVIADIGKPIDKITYRDLRAYIDGATDRERSKRMERADFVQELQGAEQEGMKED